ncbi:Thoeris anti-defense Tad2 family protein [Pararhodospirillum photometricum]|uniref:Thoeris anti-defense Tad2 family protein n=1 Tax=Pararhodospirillum photometricum TaxID=1084 RepID=UPI003BB52394
MEWKGMFLFMVEVWGYGGDMALPCLPFIAMKTADNKVVPWLASQTDVLAKDWVLTS